MWTCHRVFRYFFAVFINLRGVVWRLLNRGKSLKMLRSQNVCLLSAIQASYAALRTRSVAIMIPARGVYLVLPFLIACGSKWSFEDGDGDGVSAAEGDCWDRTDGPEGSGLKGSDIFPGAAETWYDGIDQNCNGDDDYDADGDGYIQDIHVGLGTEGIEESGFLIPGDCWDDPVGPLDGALSGDRINPAASDTWYDGIDQNCAGDDDFDADGDGFVTTSVPYAQTVPIEDSGTLAEGDCVDNPSGVVTIQGDAIEGAEIYPEAADAWYDGVDQNCAGDDDFDQDKDGYRSGAVADENGEFGLDCLDAVEEEELPIEEVFRAGIDETDLTNAEVLAHYGLKPADFNPDATDEPYDGFDLNCDLANDCDADGDGWDAADPEGPFCGDEPTAELCTIVACENIDCNDSDASIRPTDGVPEIFYNGIDDNCNLELDGDGDADGDGFWVMDYEDRVPDSELEVPFGKEGDCNDDDATIAPGLYDEPYDGLDGDCLGDDDFDQDRDGFVKTGHAGDVTRHSLDGDPLPGTGILLGGDCRDLDPYVNPAMNEDCFTPYDDDCDEDENDEDADSCTVYFADRDGDLFGKPGDSKCYCSARDEYTEDDDADCDDESAVTYPGAAESEAVEACHKDADGDGYGDASSGPFTPGVDCDDDRSRVNPSVNEDCDTEYDDDCDSDVNDLDAEACTNFFADNDEDGFGDPGDFQCRCAVFEEYNQDDSDDCDDTSPVAASTYPGAAEFEDTVACHRDVDGDGYGDSSIGVFTAGQDCDDSRPLVNPAVNEDCGTDYDDDCDTNTNDEGATSCDTFFADRDDDSFGKPGDSRCYCEPAGDYDADNSSDCDDGSDRTYPGAAYEESTSDCMRDADSDGFGDSAVSAPIVPGADCDDSLSAVNPDANEDCLTDYDDNCDLDTNNENADDCDEFFADRDGDGFGLAGDSKCYCNPRGVYTQDDEEDCDDGSHLTHPGAAEAETGMACKKDADEDGYGDSSPPSGIDSGSDCDDGNASRNPGVTERCATGYDDNCDGDTNDLEALGCHDVYTDNDGDGFGDRDDFECRCATTPEYSYGSALDCDSSSAETFPGAAENESSTSCRKDEDLDGYGDNDPPSGVAAGSDCDDSSGLVSPAGTESCSTAADDDCDGSTNDRNADACVAWYLDSDEDGYGNPALSQCYCSASGSYSSTALLATDCNDSDSSIHPFAVDVCDDIDADCDGSYTEGIYPDMDGDGMPNCADPDVDGDGALGFDDCNHFDGTIYVGAPESCDMIDNDCDGSLVDEFDDEDGDEIPDCVDDEDGDGYPLTTDCDDDDPAANPGVTEDTADTLGVDNDCDGLIDEDTVLDMLAAGQDVLYFSELQVNPAGSLAEERNNEWFELVNATENTLYLDNWLFKMTDSTCSSVASLCDEFVVFPGSNVEVASGQAVLFCRVDSAVNTALFGGGSSEVCDYKYGSRPTGAPSGDEGDKYFDEGYRLYNTVPSALEVALRIGLVEYQVDYVDHMESSDWPSPVNELDSGTWIENEGRSLMFDGDLIGDSGASDDNDEGGNWCHSRAESLIFDEDAAGTDEHNYGSPGTINPSCTVADP